MHEWGLYGPKPCVDRMKEITDSVMSSALIRYEFTAVLFILELNCYRC